MRRVFLIVAVLLLCLCTGTAIAAGTGKSGSGKSPGLELQQAKPTQEGVLALADKYTKACEPKLQDQDKEAVKEVRDTLAQQKRAGDVFYKQAVRDIVSQLTLKLASAKSLDGLIVASSGIVKEVPKNVRALNLFGSTLFTKDKNKDAIAVFEYAMSLDAKNNLVKLNLANAYLDDNQDSKAKALLDKLEFEDSGNKAVYRALATYYYKKNNASMFREYLFKAATFKGFKRKKIEKQQEQVEEQEVKQADSTGVMENKLVNLEDTVPLTPADIIEEDFPDAAQKIRDKYCKLAENEKWILPKLPQTNLNGPPDYQRNKPIVEEWMEVSSDRFSIFAKRAAAEAGIDLKASEEVRQQQAQAAGMKKAQEALQQAQQSLKYMENIPGMSKADIAKAKAALQQATKKQGIKLEDKPVDMAAPPPGIDSGSLFARENWDNYKRIQTSYTTYFMKYHKEMMAKFIDIAKVYQQKVKEEDERFDQEMDQLTKEHNQEGNPHGDADGPCRRAMINHKKRLNSISDSSYRQWSNLYMPQYAQKMKPNLDAFFKVCMLHIRNMNDPKLMEQEYNVVTMAYTMYSMQSMGYIKMGDDFAYHPETEEEERQLEEDIARAKEEAESKKEEFKQAFKSPEFSWTDWINDHFVLEVSGEFLALKVSPKAIEFEAYVPGVGAGAKYDFSEQKFETYTGFGGKLEVGVNICGIGAKAEAKGDFYRRTATWDLANGKYSESDSAKAEVKGAFGPLSAGGEFELDTQLNAKYSTKVSFMDTFTVQDQQELH